MFEVKFSSLSRLIMYRTIMHTLNINNQEATLKPTCWNPPGPYRDSRWVSELFIGIG